jgi:hypothetical protein
MTAPTVDFEDVVAAGHLLPLEDALEILGTTEPLEEVTFALDGSDKVAFELPKDWNEGMKQEGPDTLTEATVTINDSGPFQLRKEALLTMTSAIGLTKDYALKSPGPLTQANLNYWVKNHGVKQAEGMRMLAKDGVALTFIKSSLTTFPNLAVVDQVVGRLKNQFKTEDLWVDYKMAHSLERTALRVIVPSAQRTIESARHASGKEDNWSVGVQVTNSMAGHPETKLSISGYLFAWWCTNGAISTHASSGNYNRRIQGQDFDEVLEWVGKSTDDILAGLLDSELDAIQDLTSISLEGELNETLRDVFDQLKIPRPARTLIVDKLVDSDDLTAYGLMQAITQAANEGGLTDKVREDTMRVGGAVAHAMADRCNACHRVRV